MECTRCGKTSLVTHNKNTHDRTNATNAVSSQVETENLNTHESKTRKAGRPKGSKNLKTILSE